MIAQAPEGRAAPSYGLRDVRNLVPHDRVDHLEPLSRDGLQRLAVQHASGAAARVVLAPSAIGSGEAVAREDEQVLQALVALARRDARPVRRLPDVEPYDGSRPSRWCHGGILQSSGRSGAIPATPTLPGRGARARQFPISRSERRAPSVATPPPGPLRGRGRQPSGGARSAAPRGLPVS